MRTRRQFLKGASRTLLAVSLAPGVALGAPRPYLAHRRLNFSSFASLVGTRFRAFPDGAPPMSLVLVKAEALPTTPGGECFSLLFQGAGEATLEQGTYRFAHTRLGQFDMFVVPKPADDQGPYLEAVFNRLAE